MPVAFHSVSVALSEFKLLNWQPVCLHRCIVPAFFALLWAQGVELLLPLVSRGFPKASQDHERGVLKVAGLGYVNVHSGCDTGLKVWMTKPLPQGVSGTEQEAHIPNKHRGRKGRQACLLLPSACPAMLSAISPLNTPLP